MSEKRYGSPSCKASTARWALPASSEPSLRSTAKYTVSTWSNSSALTSRGLSANSSPWPPWRTLAAMA